MTDQPTETVGRETLTSYAELAEIITHLPMLAREHRRGGRLSLRTAADQIGMGFNSLYRFEKGCDVNFASLVAILRWLDTKEDR